MINMSAWTLSTNKPAINLNDLSVRITEAEGKKVSLPIGQVKEVIRLTLKELKNLTLEEVASILKRIK